MWAQLIGKLSLLPLGIPACTPGGDMLLLPAQVTVPVVLPDTAPMAVGIVGLQRSDRRLLAAAQQLGPLIQEAAAKLAASPGGGRRRPHRQQLRGRQPGKAARERLRQEAELRCGTKHSTPADSLQANLVAFGAHWWDALICAALAMRTEAAARGAPVLSATC